MNNLCKLIDELRKLKSETAWIEFKHNNYKPSMIGEDISAIANAATNAERDCGYMIWGIDNVSHQVIGTEYNLQTLKVGNEEIENWLRHNLSDNANFEFNAVEYEGKMVGVLRICAAVSRPVSFDKMAFIRVGSYTKKLRDYPEVESNLWSRLKNVNFEKQFSRTDLEASQAIDLIDVGIFFEKAQVPRPTNDESLLKKLCEERILVHQDNGLYAITNMGAVLFARRMSDFPRVSRKAIRVIQYHGNNRMQMAREFDGTKGYAVGFEGLVTYLQALTPADAPINGSFRENKQAYPELAIRELVANALIHQDFSIAGAGPLIEVFKDRLEISNPGDCLVDIERIINCTPRSRNEDIAALMRRMKMCEEAGGGWDKAVISCEEMLLNAPKIEKFDGGIKVYLFSKADFSAMTQDERLWACYTHACVLHEQFEQMTNASLRHRFGLSEASSGNVSRVIKDAVNKGLVRPLDPTTAPRYMKYVPAWA